MSSPKREFHIALIGKTGKGKSSSGNSILGRYCFEESGNFQSCSKDVLMMSTTFQQDRITIYDTPGLCDSELNAEEDEKKTYANMKLLMSLCEGLDALVLVLSYPLRNTPEEERIVTSLKKIFGDDFVSRHCVCVITCGDALSKDIDIKDWCRGQRGKLAEFFKELDYRVIFFYNKGKQYQAQRKAAVTELIDMVRELTDENGVYLNNNFKAWSEHRKQEAIKFQLPQLISGIKKKICLLDEQLYRVSQDDTNGKVLKRSLIRSVNDLLEEIDKEADGTDLLDDFKEQVEDIKSQIMSLEVEKKEIAATQIMSINNEVKVISNPPEAPNFVRALVTGAAVAGVTALTGGVAPLAVAGAGALGYLFGR